MCKKKSYVVSAAIVVAVVTMLFFPVTGTAGSLDPVAAPAPTMKTLDQIPPTWSQSLQCDSTASCPRFQLVLDDAAVLDKETGLVWEKSPYINANVWLGAMGWCQSRSVGNRKGWRLPTVEELSSLVDPTATTPPFLPSGNPFLGVQSLRYWSATTLIFDTTYAYIVNFGNGLSGGILKDNSNYMWCVRGGQGYDAY